MATLLCILFSFHILSHPNDHNSWTHIITLSIYSSKQKSWQPLYGKNPRSLKFTVHRVTLKVGLIATGWTSSWARSVFYPLSSVIKSSTISYWDGTFTTGKQRFIPHFGKVGLETTLSRMSERISSLRCFISPFSKHDGRNPLRPWPNNTQFQKATSLLLKSHQDISSSRGAFTLNARREVLRASVYSSTLWKQC